MPSNLGNTIPGEGEGLCAGLVDYSSVSTNHLADLAHNPGKVVLCGTALRAVPNVKTMLTAERRWTKESGSDVCTAHRAKSYVPFRIPRPDHFWIRSRASGLRPLTAAPPRLQAIGAPQMACAGRCLTGNPLGLSSRGSLIMIFRFLSFCRRAYFCQRIHE